MIKRMVSLWLVLVMAFALCACGKAGNIEEKPTASLVGTWQADVDIADYLNETAGLEYTVERFVIRIQLSFKDDGTAAMSFDRDYMNQQQKEMADNMWQVMMQMHAEDLGMEPYEVEQILIESGWSADILVSTMGLNTIIDQMEDKEGRWLLEGNLLYMDGEVPENAQAIEISLEADRFSMTGGEGIKTLLDGVISEDRITHILPVLFERI